MIYNRKTRRQFLVGSGRTFLALPFLPSLFPRTAWGQQLPVEKRFIATWLPLGGFSNTELYPSYIADQQTMLYAGQSIHSTNLRQSPGLGAISTIYSAALNPYLPKLNVLRGLDTPIPFSHGENTFLGHFRHVRGLAKGNPNGTTGDTQAGYPALPSIDQYLAYHPNFYSSTPTLRSVNGYGDDSGRVGLATPNNLNGGLAKVSTLNTPLDVFNALFGVGNPVQSGGPTPDALNSKTIVDQVLTDLQSTLKHRNIASSDKAQLDSFTTELFELQNKLQATTPLNCTAPNKPAINQSMGSLANDTLRVQFYDMYTSVIVAGIKCGRTKIATMKGILNLGSQGRYGNEFLHGWGHSGQKTLVGDSMRWMLENAYVPLLKKLDVPEANGKTFLDNSIVMFGNENSQSVHTGWDRPILLAGSAGGFLKTGHFVDYRQNGVKTRYETPGILYNQLMVTILQAMGVPSTDPILKQYAYAELIGGTPGSFWNTLRQDNGEHPHKDCIKHAGELLPIIA